MEFEYLYFKNFLETWGLLTFLALVVYKAQECMRQLYLVIWSKCRVIEMESKWLWMVLVALLLGGWCDGCWEQEKTAFLQLKPFFSEIWEEGKQTLDCCEWNWVKCNKSTRRVTQLFLNLTTTEVSGDLIYRYYEDTFMDDSYNYNSRRDDWYLNATLFLPFEELKSLYLSGNFIAGCVYNEGLLTLTLLITTFISLYLFIVI